MKQKHWPNASRNELYGDLLEDLGPASAPSSWVDARNIDKFLPSLEDSVLHVGNERLGEIPARHSHDREFFPQEPRLL